MRAAAVVLFSFVATGALFSQDGPPPAPQRPSLIRIHPLLSALDSDHDGVISSAELSRAPEVLPKLDANKDGVISPDELRPQGFGRRPEGGRAGGPGEARGPEASDLVKTLMTFDANGDGKLARTEVPERMQGLFDRADTNKDGVLTSDELTKLADAQQQSAAQGERRGEFGRGGPGGPGGRGGRGMRMDRVMQAMDTDHDGTVSAAEMRAAATSLKTLDTNHDGQITEDEVRPNFGRPGENGFDRARGNERFRGEQQ